VPPFASRLRASLLVWAASGDEVLVGHRAPAPSARGDVCSLYSRHGGTLQTRANTVQNCHR
jgi:hypothetical protein